MTWKKMDTLSILVKRAKENLGFSQLDLHRKRYTLTSMARLPRIVVLGQPLYIMNCGNNRQNIFESDHDIFRFREDISVSFKKTECRLHAYVIMTNHLHFLLTPDTEKALASFMLSVANR